MNKNEMLWCIKGKLYEDHGYSPYLNDFIEYLKEKFNHVQIRNRLFELDGSLNCTEVWLQFNEFIRLVVYIKHIVEEGSEILTY